MGAEHANLTAVFVIGLVGVVLLCALSVSALVIRESIRKPRTLDDEEFRRLYPAIARRMRGQLERRD